MTEAVPAPDRDGVADDAEAIKRHLAKTRSITIEDSWVYDGPCTAGFPMPDCPKASDEQMKEREKAALDSGVERVMEYLRHCEEEMSAWQRAKLGFVRRLRRLRELKWWFLHRFHPAHRHHVIKIGPPGWKDKDLLMEAVMVKLLVDFYEEEKPEDVIDVLSSNDAENWVELKELYEFFKANDHADLGHDVLTEKLSDLVRLRGLMWT